MKNLFLIAFGFCMLNLNAQQKQEFVLQKVNFAELQSIISQNDDVLYVVNFWATWCKPCIEELPGFMKVNDQFKDNPKFKMILISFDHRSLLNTKVKKFIEKNNLTVDVYLLDDEKSIMELLPDIDPLWTGAIPSTGFYKNGKKLKFHQMTMSQFELEDLVNEFL